MNRRYLEPFAGARWAISRVIAGERIYLIENSRMDRQQDIELILRTLKIGLTAENIALYFPERGEQGKCPTLDLLELFSTIDRVVEEQRPAVTV